MITTLLLMLLAADEADPHIMAEGHAPTPYTAEEIKKGCPQGRILTMSIEQPEKDPIRQTMKFKSCDETGATIETTRMKKDGTPLGAATSAVSTWKELQHHASYPETETKITDVEIETPAGKFKCKLYTVTKKQGEKTTVTRYHFATTMAGPPVRMVTEVDGKVTFTMTLVEHKMP